MVIFGLLKHHVKLFALTSLSPQSGLNKTTGIILFEIFTITEYSFIYLCMSRQSSTKVILGDIRYTMRS